MAKNNAFYKRWRDVQLYVPADWSKWPGFEDARTKELAKLDGQVAELEAKIDTLRQTTAHKFVLKPSHQ